MQIAVSELGAALEEVNPIRASQSELCLASSQPVIERSDGTLSVVLRLIFYDVVEPSGELQIRDIKEQEVSFVPAPYRDEPDRVRAYVEGWAAAVGEVFAGWSHGRIETSMPYDLVDTTVLKLARAETASDFRQALLKKSRLGKLLTK